MRLDGPDLGAGMTGEDVAVLHRDLTRLGFTLSEFERRVHLFGATTTQAVTEFRRAHGLPTIGTVDHATAAALTRAVTEMSQKGVMMSSGVERAPQLVPDQRVGASTLAGDPATNAIVVGRLYLDRGQPAAAVKLRAYHGGFGGQATLLGESTSDARGAYRLGYTTDGKPVNLEMRALGAGGKEVSISQTVFGAPDTLVLNLVVPAYLVPTASEYTRLRGDLRTCLNGASLADAMESGDRRDLTVLASATRWDVRLVALAANAEKLATTTGIESEALFGMLRAGLPSDAVQLARVTTAGVGLALRKAVDAGVIELDDTRIGTVRAAFERFAVLTRRMLTGPGLLSTYGEMLAASGLAERDQGRFEEIFAAHSGTVDELWHKLEAAGVPIGPVQITARLGFLTLNNAELIKDLRAGIGDPKEIGRFLVDQRLYLTETWVDRLRSQSDRGGGALDRLVPPAYVGQVDERVQAYAADLARKVRLSYPTHVIRAMVATDQLRLGERHDEVKADVAAVLDNALAIDGFEIGQVPLNAFLRKYKEQVFGSLPEERATAAADQVAMLFRLYQITPTDEAMQVLLNHGFTSAYDVAALTRATFLKRYGDKFPSREQALTVYLKAEQATTVVHSFFGAVAQVAAAPPVNVLSPPQQVVDDAKNKLVEQYPTIENLFGPQDWVACDECRSVLSPAAYLVDILKFLDPDEQAWKSELDAWAADHPGKPDPVRPYEVLAARRRDIPVLKLTCENTQTAMPYIDIVNEILEYYVAHGALDEEAAHDTGDAGTEDLLAEPQNILPEAYDVLRTARYPLALPFDLWLETVRRFCEHFTTPFWQLLDALRPTDELCLPSGGPGYGRSEVFRERLGITPAEYELFTTDGQATTWYELYGSSDNDQALGDLTSARTLARALGISYRELIDVLRTRFVNPNLVALAALRKVGVFAEDVLRYFAQPGHAPFTAAETAAFEAKLGPDALTWLQGAWAGGEFARILVLADPDPGGGFEKTTVGYVDGSGVDPMPLLFINYFVRLRRRLGWSIAETDDALCTFLPQQPDPRTPAAIGPAMRSALLGISHYAAVAEMLQPSAKMRPRLLRLWSSLDDATYVELFLAGSPPLDDAFDDPLGHYLSGSSESLQEHLNAVQGGLQLSADEINQILIHTGTSLEMAKLDMDTVSLLYRYRLLSTMLKLTIAELIALARLSGIDPFTPLLPGPVTTADEDNPYRYTHRYIEIFGAVRRSGVPIPELEYLLAHRFDPVGPYRAAADPPLALVRTLAADITRIQSENSTLPEPLTFTDEILRQKLALVFPSTVVETFLGYWAGTASYDETAVDQFFTSNLVKTTIGARSYGFLDPDDRQLIFPPDPVNLTEASQRKRRTRLVDTFLPYLRDWLVRKAIVQAVAADLGCAPTLADTLLTDPTLLDDFDQTGSPLLPAYAAVGDPGLSETANASSARIDGFIEVPADGTYRFAIAGTTQGSQVDLRFDHVPDPLVHQTTSADQAEFSADIELKANMPYGLTASATALSGGTITVRVQGPQLPLGTMDRLVRYPRLAVDHLHRTHLLLAKAIRLISAFALDEREVVHLLTHRDDFDGLDLGELPTNTATDDTADATTRTLFGWFLRLADYVRLRTALAARPHDLVELLAHARRSYPVGTDPAAAATSVLTDVVNRLAVITRRTPETVGAAATLLTLDAKPTVSAQAVSVVAPGFVSERGLSSLWQVLALAARIGVSPQALKAWATPAPTSTTARDLRDSVKAVYDRQRWRAVAQPIFDTLRQRRRDALVAHIMHTRQFDRIEQLFEYFLIDPGTEPVVQASRLGLAISSVQTFVQRCLLNLEDEVPASLIDADKWRWMKRYRVWEANRKIFLWPENWLEPEWRDDKTHLFTALESTLLQSNLSNEDVEGALFTYLQGLEEIARLDVRAIYLEEKANAADNVLHMMARTYGKPHAYYYRTYAYGMWTPWVPVTSKIDGDHVTMVMWRGRLHLFWLTFLDQAEASSQGVPSATSAGDMHVGDLVMLSPTHRYQAQLSWSEYVEGRWSNAASTAFTQLAGQSHDIDIFRWPKMVTPDGQFIHATVDDDNAVQIHLTSTGSPGNQFILVGKNSVPTMMTSAPPTAPPYTNLKPSPGGQYHFGSFDLTHPYADLTVTYVEEITTSQGHTTYSCPTTRPILRKGTGYTMAAHVAPLRHVPGDIGPLVSPFAYQNDRHTLYVEPTLTEHMTIETADEFLVTRPLVRFDLDDPQRWEAVELQPHAPIEPDPIEEISAAAAFRIDIAADWVTAPSNRIPFDGSLIGVDGQLGTPTAQSFQ